MRLRDLSYEGTFTYADLWCLLQTLPPGHRLHNIYNHPDQEPHDKWDLTNMLLASSVDALNTLIWQKTKNGQKGKKPPRPIPRPGVKDDQDREINIHKDTLIDLNEAQKIFERN